MNSIRLRFAMAFFPLALPLCAPAAEYITYIGTSGPNSKGIYAFRFDSKSGKLNPLGLVAETPRPSFLALHPNNRYLYAVAEANGGAVSAFGIDAKTGELTLLKQDIQL